MISATQLCNESLVSSERQLGVGATGWHHRQEDTLEGKHTLHGELKLEHVELVLVERVQHGGKDAASGGLLQWIHS